jgi:hypothetical protein
MTAKKSHFETLSVLDHLKKAREKGKKVSSDLHAVEAPGHFSAAADSAKETAVSTLLIQMICTTLGINHRQTLLLLSLYLVGILLWKVGRSAHLGWARLERIKKAVFDEKYEIENNREEEREELTNMYAAKGLTEPLLGKVIDVLMADDNKLLALMLEEELGIPMDSYVHPLKQALGAAFGVIITATLLPVGLAISENYGLFVTTFCISACASFLMAKIEGLQPLEYTIKGISITFLSTFATYFLTQFLILEWL